MAISCIKNIRVNTVPEIEWKTLIRADRTLAVPFRLDLAEQQHSAVICEQIVRVMPGKRLVAFGTWDDQPVVIKLFYETHSASRHFKREVSGVEALVEYRIPTPALIYKGTAKNKRIKVLIFERIVDAFNLDEIWQSKTCRQTLLPLMRAVTIELATQHVLGVVQRDLHFKNILIKGKHIYTLDGGSIEFTDGLLPKKQSLEHLALFFAQLGVGTEEIQRELFHTYTKARGWLVKKADVECLQAALKKWNNSRWKRFEKKIARNSTAFGLHKNSKAFIMHDRNDESAELMGFLNQPELIFSQHGTEILKAGRSSTVIKALIDNKPYIIKRYNMKNSLHWLRRCLRPSRAATSWRLAHLLRHFGVATARPVAFIERRFLGLRWKSYFVMEYVEGSDLASVFSHYAKDDSDYDNLAALVVVLFNNLAKLSMTHGDLKATNILIREGCPVLIDLDGMVTHQTQSSLDRAVKKDMKRFMKNWDALPSVRALFQTLLAKGAAAVILSAAKDRHDGGSLS